LIPETRTCEGLTTTLICNGQRIKYYENIKQQALIMTKLKDEMVEGVQGSSGERWESFKFW